MIGLVSGTCPLMSLFYQLNALHPPGTFVNQSSDANPIKF